jgi:hypothetical protein
MFRNACCLGLILFVIFSCKKEEDPFLISKQSIGSLTDSTQVKDLDVLYSNDSISKYIGGDEFTGNINDIEVFEKGGNLLFILTPSEALDSTSTIKTIRVVDSRYKTSTGLNSNSTFKDLVDNYKISSIQNTLRNVIVSIDDLSAFFTIEKSELPAEMRYNMNLKIDAIQIPDKAKINHFYLQWH